MRSERATCYAKELADKFASRKSPIKSKNYDGQAISSNNTISLSCTADIDSNNTDDDAGSNDVIHDDQDMVVTAAVPTSQITKAAISSKPQQKESSSATTTNKMNLRTATIMGYKYTYTLNVLMFMCTIMSTCVRSFVECVFVCLYACCLSSIHH